MRCFSCASRVLLCVVVVALPNQSEAHHSAAMFNQKEVVAVSGRVIRFEWRNPHVYLTVEDALGDEWLIETDTTGVLTRSGWSRDSFSTRDIVSARVHPSRSSADRRVLLVSIQAPDGLILDSLNSAGRDNESGAARASSIAGIWTSKRSQPSSFIQAWREHPLTAKALAARADFDPRVGTAADCVAWPTPFFMVANYWHLNKIDDLGDTIVIRSEFYNAERTIYLDGRQHPEDGQRTVQGHSIGWWEGDTLVIDSRLFSYHPSPVSTGIGIPSGEEKHVLERLTLSDDGTQLQIDVVVDDPEYLAEPLSTQFTWDYAPHLAFVSAPCDSVAAIRFLQ
jgi:hypothetical protein